MIFNVWIFFLFVQHEHRLPHGKFTPTDNTLLLLLLICKLFIACASPGFHRPWDRNGWEPFVGFGGAGSVGAGKPLTPATEFSVPLREAQFVQKSLACCVVWNLWINHQSPPCLFHLQWELVLWEHYQHWSQPQSHISRLESVTLLRRKNMAGSFEG